MGYLKEEYASDQIIEKIKEQDYALMFKISEMFLKKAVDITEKDLDEITEARAFSERSEIHIFRQNDQLKCLKITDSDQNDILTERYALENRFGAFGKTVVVKKYVGYDEDGQAYVELKRLAGIE